MMRIWMFADQFAEFEHGNQSQRPCSRLVGIVTGEDISADIVRVEP